MKKSKIHSIWVLAATPFMVLLLLSACFPSPAARVKKHLITSMDSYLNTSSPGGKTARFEVLDVNYYDDKLNYQCEFQVKMHENGKDTTGTMAAQISRDFRQIKRKH